jgi:hypothetical protein
VRPKDMTRYSYNPYLVEKVIFGTSCGGFLSDDNPTEDQ